MIKGKVELSILLALVFSSFAMAVPPENFVGNWKGKCGVGTGSEFDYSVDIKYNAITKSFTYIGLTYPFGSVGTQGDALGTTTSTAGWDDTQTTLVLTKAEIWVSLGPKLFAQAGVVERAELSMNDGKLTAKTWYNYTVKQGTGLFVCKYEK